MDGLDIDNKLPIVRPRTWCLGPCPAYPQGVGVSGWLESRQGVPPALDPVLFHLVSSVLPGLLRPVSAWGLFSCRMLLAYGILELMAFASVTVVACLSYHIKAP